MDSSKRARVVFLPNPPQFIPHAFWQGVSRYRTTRGTWLVVEDDQEMESMMENWKALNKENWTPGQSTLFKADELNIESLSLSLRALHKEVLLKLSPELDRILALWKEDALNDSAAEEESSLSNLISINSLRYSKPQTMASQAPVQSTGKADLTSKTEEDWFVQNSEGFDSLLAVYEFHYKSDLQSIYPEKESAMSR